MRMLTWNVNGIRSHSLSVAQILQKLDADVVCFQETKITRDMLDTPTAIIDGYTSYHSFCKTRSGYSGVATYCRDSFQPTNALDSLQNSEDDLGRIGRDEMLKYFGKEYLNSLDREGRTVLTEHTVSYGDERKSLVIINLYCPRVDPDKPDRQNYQTDFHKLVQIKTEALIELGRHVVVIGDLNVSHRKMDHCKPEEHPDFEKRPSRLWLDQFLRDIHHPKLTTCENPQCTCGLPHPRDDDLNDPDGDLILIEPESKRRDKKLSKAKGNRKSGRIVSQKDADVEQKRKIMIDLFRYYHPSRKDGFTCWNSATGARKLNYGTRLDYVICDTNLPTKSCDIKREVEGSDHCPLFADLDVKCEASEKTPKCCTKFFPELIGKQSKLSDYFRRGKIESDNSKEEGYSLEANDRPEKRSLKSTKAPISKKPKLTKSSSEGGPLFQSFGFKRTTSDPQPRSIEMDDERAAKETPSTKSLDEQIEPTPELVPTTTTAMAAGWGALFKQPDKPNCKGHKKPCVLRTVTKKSPNRGREFWVCARPEGPKTNPESRCDHFEWVSKSKPKSSKS